MQMDQPKIYLYRRIVQAKLFMDANHASPIALKNISGEACFSTFHFIRAFRKIYGCTPYQYLIKLRLQKAEILLRNGSPVSEACYLVGFESPGSFSALFKRRHGVAPSAYWRQWQECKKAIENEPLHFVPGCFAERKGWKKKSNFEEVRM
jgi:AraC-like DNA-binding protein